MDDALREREKLMDQLLTLILKVDKNPPEKLMKSLCLHKSLVDFQHKLSAPGSIRIDYKSMIEKYSPTVEVVEETQNESLRCPITQSAIVKCWDAPCGHKFEELAGKEYFKINRKCPVMGCAGKSHR